MVRIASVAALVLSLSSWAQAQTPKSAPDGEALPQAAPASDVAPIGNTVPVSPERAMSGPSTQRVWYGWQTLLSDAVASGLLVASDLSSDAVVDLALGTYALGGPLVHVAHGNWGLAGGSLGLRVGAPLLFAGLIRATDDCSGEEEDVDMSCEARGVLTGVGVGALTAMVIDSLVLAYDSKAVKPAVSPAVTVNSRGASLSFSGRF